MVLSINCSSGAYDYDETSFAGEALVNPNGGAVGVFGDTRDSPSTGTTRRSRSGFVDALLPSVLPSEGPATKQRTGDALIHGKLRLAGMSPPGGDGNTRNELYLWHYFGDPAMQMWGGGSRSMVLDPARSGRSYKARRPRRRPTRRRIEVVVNVAEGAASASRSACYRAARSSARRSPATAWSTIPAAFGGRLGAPGELEVAVEADGSPPIRIPVQNEPQRGATSVTGDCAGGQGTNDAMTMTGVLSGAPAGSVVSVTYHHESGVTHVEQATTNAQGGYQTSYVGNLSGDWDITARYAGTDQYAPSASEPCIINSG